MTEEEAKTKWCPHTRGRLSNNMYNGERSSYRCIASACMMWTEYEKQYTTVVKGYIKEEGGYCGLTR